MKKEPRFAAGVGPQRFANTDPWKGVPFVDPNMPEGEDVIEWLLFTAMIVALLGTLFFAFGV